MKLFNKGKELALVIGMSLGMSVLTPVLPTIQVEASSYNYTADQLQALANLNKLRAEAGMKPVKLDPFLTKAATNHFNYLNTNGHAYGHGEVKGHKGFTGVKPQDRVLAVGGSVGEYLSENIVFGTNIHANSIMDLVHEAPLHREGLLNPDLQSVGIEAEKGNQKGFHVIKLRIDEYGERATDHVYPVNGMKNVNPLFGGNEIPNPLKDYGIAQSGHILTYWLPLNVAVSDGDLTFVLKDSKGATVPAFLDFFYSGTARLIPKQQLKWGETYTATVKWKARHTSATGGRTWSFTTMTSDPNGVTPPKPTPPPVEVIKESKDYTVIKAQPLYASNSTSSKQIVQVPANAKVRSIEKRASWMKVTYNGSTGWVAVNNLKAYVAPKTVTMYANKATKAYTTRSTKGKVAFNLANGAKVTRTGVNGSWSQVKFGTKTGWIASRDLSAVVLANRIKTQYGSHIYGVNNQAEYDAVMKIVKDEFTKNFNSSQFDTPDSVIRFMNGERGTKDKNDPAFRSPSNAGLLNAEMSLSPVIEGKISFETYQKLNRVDSFVVYLKTKYNSKSVVGDKSVKSAYDALINKKVDCDADAQLRSMVYDMAGIDNVVVGDGVTHAVIVFKVKEGWTESSLTPYSKKDIDSLNSLSVYLSYTQSGAKIQ